MVTLSPSTLQTLADCPLRWLLERHGGTDGRDVRSAVGSLLHALVADPGKTESQMLDELEKVWEKAAIRVRSGMPTTSWTATGRCCRPSRSGGRRPATSSPRSAPRSTSTGWSTSRRQPPAVRVRGRLDRLERDSAGRLVVVDIKTGKSPVSKDDAQRHAQLAMYQLAVAEGLLPTG